MEMPMVAVLILLTLLVHVQGASATTLRQVERRVRVLEMRTQNDASEFRHTMDAVLERLNSSESNSVTQDCFNGTSKELIVNLSSLQSDLTTNYDRLKRGFSGEKQYLRQSLDTVSNELGDLKEMCHNANREFNKTLYSFHKQEQEINKHVLQRFEEFTNEGGIMQTLSTKLDEISGQNERLGAKIGDITTGLQSTSDKVERVSKEVANSQVDVYQFLLTFFGLRIYKFEDSLYLAGYEKVDFDSASRECKKLGGYLAEVTSEEENDFVISIAKENFVSGYRDVWIGGQCDQDTGVWTWIHSNTYLSDTFTSWSPGQPSGSPQWCLQIWASQHYLWDDDRCNKNANYICEMSHLWGVIASRIRDFP